MCNSSAFCIYQTLLKNLTDNRVNQIKKLIKLILRYVFCHAVALSCNNSKKNTITKKKKNCNISNITRERNKVWY